MKNLFPTLALVVSSLGLSPAALAHEVPCPLCGLKVVQATKTQDNEVVLRFGKKRIEYRCVYCALADAKKYDGDLFVYAPSETKGKPVILSRAAGRWSVVKVEGERIVPAEGAVFLNAFDGHKECAALSRAFHSQAGFDAYKPKAKDAKSLTLDEMLAKAGVR
jgi:hypothetical protein